MRRAVLLLGLGLIVAGLLAGLVYHQNWGAAALVGVGIGMVLGCGPTSTHA